MIPCIRCGGSFPTLPLLAAHTLTCRTEVRTPPAPHVVALHAAKVVQKVASPGSQLATFADDVVAFFGGGK